MPLSLDQQYNLSANDAFRHRIAQAFYAIAKEVRDEPTSTPLHEFRVTLTTNIMLSETQLLNRYAAQVCSSPAIRDLNVTTPNEIPDSAILDAVRQLWNYLVR